MIFLTEDDVNELVSMDDALKAVRIALDGQGQGTTNNAIRSRARLGPLNLNILGGAVDEKQSLGAKIYVTGSGAAKFWFMLFASDGTCDALMEADRLGQLRTGAASGISSQSLARADSDVLGLIGSGYQAWTQAEAIVRSANISKIRVFSRNPQNAQKFATDFSERFSVLVEPVTSVDRAIDDADIVVTMTSSHNPIIEANHLRPGTHYVFAGSNNPLNSEAAPALLSGIDVLVTDDLDQARIEGGTLLRAVNTGTISWETVGLLGDVIAGKAIGRESDSQTTAFVAHGAGSCDTALGRIACEKATAQGRGVVLPITGGVVAGRR